MTWTSWCGHCQKLKSSWEKLPNALKGIVKVGAVNCDDEKNKQLCNQEGVDSFPTIKLYKSGGRGSVPYEGAQTVKALHDFALEHLPSEVVNLSERNARRVAPS
eukprot:752888-Hanusia_phi.AAC.8